MAIFTLVRVGSIALRRSRRKRRAKALAAEREAARRKLNNMREAIREVNRYATMMNSAYNGLEDLKLGHITLFYTITGLVNRSGTVGTQLVGGGKQRLIANNVIRKKHTTLTVNAFSYRGYRFITDRDRTQGRGISPVMRRAFR